MRLRERCKCGSEFEGRAFWGGGLESLVKGWRKWNAVHSQVCMGIESYTVKDDGTAVVGRRSPAPAPRSPEGAIDREGER